jgi:hypothetical protein
MNGIRMITSECAFGVCISSSIIAALCDFRKPEVRGSIPLAGSMKIKQLEAQSEPLTVCGLTCGQLECQRHSVEFHFEYYKFALSISKLKKLNIMKPNRLSQNKNLSIRLPEPVIDLA